jgi:hypothetical protein
MAHDWRNHGLSGSARYVPYPDYACSKCGAVITGRETACKPAPGTCVGTDQIPDLQHLPLFRDEDGEPTMLTCDEVQVFLVMES